MPAPPKPGVNWPAIKARYIDGESANRIANDHPVSRQAIEKRATKEGWKDAALATFRRTSASIIGDRGKRTPENADRAVELIREGLSQRGVCRAIGFDSKGIVDWMQTDPQFKARVEEAQFEFEHGKLQNIDDAAKRGDWKAAQARLAAHDSTKEDYGDTRGAGGGISIVLNIPRAAPEMVDVTPESVAIETESG